MWKMLSDIVKTKVMTGMMHVAKVEAKVLTKATERFEKVEAEWVSTRDEMDEAKKKAKIQ